MQERDARFKVQKMSKTSVYSVVLSTMEVLRWLCGQAVGGAVMPAHPTPTQRRKADYRRQAPHFT